MGEYLQSVVQEFIEVPFHNFYPLAVNTSVWAATRHITRRRPFSPRSAKYVIWKSGLVVLLLNLCPLFEPHTGFCWLEQPKLTTYLGEIRLGVPVEIQGFDRVTIGLAPQHERVLGPLNPATVRGLRLLLPSYHRGTLHPGFNVERGSTFSYSIPTFLKGNGVSW